IYIETKPGLTSEHLVILTATGEIKQAVVNEAVARRLAAQYPDLDISTPISLNQFQPWMLNKDKTALRDSLNIWIEEFKETPEYEELVSKYLK
ncbi:MAG: glutamine ABC transporter substrate-binding protein, partial [Muribaculaceae bacterium]